MYREDDDGDHDGNHDGDGDSEVIPGEVMLIESN